MFAVITNEVRQLSQKTSTASKEIKELIDISAREVKSGMELVDKTGHNIQTLLSKFILYFNHLDCFSLKLF